MFIERRRPRGAAFSVNPPRNAPYDTLAPTASEVRGKKVPGTIARPIMSDENSAEQVGGNAPPGEESAAPVAARGELPRPRPRRGLYFTILVGMIVAFAAASASGLLWWRYRQLEAALDRSDVASAGSLDDLRVAIESLQDRIEVLQRSDAALLETSGRFSASVEELAVQQRALEARVNAFQGVTGEARRRWLLAEAEHYLAVGNAELVLGGRWENAITALELADDALRQLAEPVFSPVRQRIAADLQALRSAGLVDVEGLSYTLGRLSGRVGELPMGRAAPGTFAAAEPQQLEDAESGWRRVWLSIRGAVAGMISVERSDASASPALTVRERSVIRGQFVLELEMARLGLLRDQPQVFRASLEAAGDLLARHFDETEPAVQSAAILIDEMLQLEVDPVRPDVSGSLSLLSELADRDG